MNAKMDQKDAKQSMYNEKSMDQNLFPEITVQLNTTYFRTCLSEKKCNIRLM